MVFCEGVHTFRLLFECMRTLSISVSELVSVTEPLILTREKLRNFEIDLILKSMSVLVYGSVGVKQAFLPPSY